jgi:hypothetical protein
MQVSSQNEEKKWSRGDSNPGPDKETKISSTCLFLFRFSGHSEAENEPVKYPYLRLISLMHHRPATANPACRCLIFNPARCGTEET